VRRLVEEGYPEAERIRLVCDNLSTHSAAAFYETFSPEEARGSLPIKCWRMEVVAR
jgi:hypothetical protein